MIYEINGKDRTQIDVLVNDYNGQIDKRLIEPRWYKELKPGILPNNRNILVAQDTEGTLKGLLIYRKLPKHGLEALSARLENYVSEELTDFLERNDKIGLQSRPAFCEYSGNGSIVYITNMESFEKGTGTKLIQHIQSKPELELLFLLSVDNTAGFYRKMGFEEIGIGVRSHIESDAPIMAWHKRVKGG